MAHSSSQTPVILLAFANDAEAPLRELAIEQDELATIFRQPVRDGKCELVSIAAATADKVIQAFQDYRGRIRIFHYGGHSTQDAIFIKTGYQQQKNIKKGSLAEFLALQQGLELVFLNSCLSLGQAATYHIAGVKALIATDREIGDQAARVFSQLFYSGLATGADISQAFQEAEKGFQIKKGEAVRGFQLRIGNTTDQLPWKIYPEQPHSWHFPLFATHLTRIPTIDLGKEFLGREVDMERLKDKLERASKVILINGLGGIGKTVLATAYVQEYGGKYDHMVWINQGEDLIGSFALNKDLADHLDMPFVPEEELEERFRRILRKIQQLPGRNLLVIDNAQEQIAQKAIYDLLPGSPNWQVLLTSRLKLSGFDLLPIDTLKPDAARRLFQTYYQGPYTEEELDALLTEIGFHTLTVELLAKLLNKLNNILSVSELREILQQKQLDNPDLQEKVWARHSREERGIYLHLMKAFELTRLTDKEKWLLKQFVPLPVEPYKVTILADFLQEKPLELNKTLNSLTAKGWLTLHEDKTFSIHRLIRQVVDYQFHPLFADLTTLVERMIQKMSADAYTNRLTSNVPWINYAIMVERFLATEKQELIATLQDHIAIVYRALGQYVEALEFQKKAIDIKEAVLEAGHPDLATSYNNVALIYKDLGRYSEALKFQKKVIAIKEAASEASHPDLAQSYSNIATFYKDLGQYAEALDFQKKAIAIYEAVLGTNHPNLATSYNNIAVVYRALGQYEEALQLQKKALDIKEAVLETNHPNLATSYNNVALVYRDLGQYVKALEFQKKALAIFEDVLEAKHPKLGTSYNNIAIVYRALGRYAEALEFQKKAIDIFEDVLEAKHPHLAQSYYNLALVYQALGQYAEAESYQAKANAINNS